MKTLAVITAFPPAKGSLNEYGFYLINAFARRHDIEKIIVIGDTDNAISAELNLDPKIEVRRVWAFNSIFATPKIIREIRKCKADYALFNLQTASFGDSEIPAALGLLAPMISQKLSVPTGVIMHNLIDAVDLSKTNVAGNKLRQKLISTAGTVINKGLLKAGFVSVTLDSFLDILTTKYKAKNAFLVPHGALATEKREDIPSLSDRPNHIVTMGKFGTYKRLERMISAVQRLNEADYSKNPIKLVVGGSNHPATPGYIETLTAQHQTDPNIIFHGYVAEEDVSAFFKQGKLAVFDYDSTTGSSGVLHQAATYGTPPIYPMLGDFIDVTEREGLCGYHYKPLDEDSLLGAIQSGLSQNEKSQTIAEKNYLISGGITMDTVAAVQFRLLEQVQKGMFQKLNRSHKKALWLKPRNIQSL
jgi:glycosyltransferase involved in cell wall biosynthesis